MRKLADAVLAAFAGADLDAVGRLVARGAIVYGTDAGEQWYDRDALAVALDGMRSLELKAEWREPPAEGDGWIAGTAIYRAGDGPPLETRVTMVFAGGRLTHAHFSVPVR